MSCGCSSKSQVSSWNDLLCQPPVDPRDVIAFCRLGGVEGVWALSGDYNQPAGASVWVPSPVIVQSESLVTTNGADQLQNVFDAQSWNQMHRTVNVAATVAPPLRKTVFMRAGMGWQNTVGINVGSSPTFASFQLSLLENAATRGDAQGTIPVFEWNSGPYSGLLQLGLVIDNPGRYTFGLLGIDSSSPANYSMFELDVMAVA